MDRSEQAPGCQMTFDSYQPDHYTVEVMKHLYDDDYVAFKDDPSKDGETVYYNSTFNLQDEERLKEKIEIEIMRGGSMGPTWEVDF